MKNPNRLTVKFETSAVTALVYRASGHPIRRTLILGHGAGAGQQSAFMVTFASALAALGLDAVTFNFLYTEQHRRIPDRAPLLEACYRAVIEAVAERVESAEEGLFIGGKSMGGRIATQVAAADPELPIAGLVLLGYPLHPPGKPHERRDKHLAAIRRPMLVVQGSRDAFGTPAELAPVLERLSPPPVVHVVTGGDHSFKVARQTAQQQAAAYSSIQQAIVRWIAAVTPARRTASP